MLHLNLIGVPEIILDGRAVTFARRGSIALLAYLALSGRRHARETLATLLAGDSSDEQAHKYLSNVLVDLRQHIGDYVVAARQTVAFDRGRPHRLDVAEFQTHMPKTPDGVVADFEVAIALYRDEFLAGLSLAGAPDFEAWLFAEREELRGQYLQVLRSQIDASLRKGAWDTGIAAARRLLAEEPWMEEAHRQLMVMLARSGQRKAAIAQYQVCCRVLREELGVEPQPGTTALLNRLRAALTPPPHNLPLAATQPVGRVEQVRLLTTLLADPDCRLATIAGLGGSGKTCLALAVAREFATPPTLPAEQPFPDGIVFAPFAEVAGLPDACHMPPAEAGHRILTAIDAALGLAEADGDPRRRVIGHLRHRAVLLVLDNLEQLQAGSGVLSELLAEAANLKLLVTSRIPLHLAGERVLYIDGLALPTGPDDLEQAEASALFLQEARRISVGFALSPEDRVHVVNLCRLLGGFPLALILAARWVPVLSCGALVSELERGLDMLATTEPDLPERHRSVSAILDGILACLPTDDRALVQSLAVASTKREPDSRAASSRMSTELLPRARLLREQAILRLDQTDGTLELHPLLRPHVRVRDAARATCY